MESRTDKKKRKVYAGLLFTLLLIFLFVYNRVAISHVLDPKPQAPVNSANSLRTQDPWNQYHSDSCISLVSDGDLILRAGSDPISLLFIKANSHDKTFSHAGIVFIENGYPMVYNSIATAEEPHAEVSRDSLKKFIEPFNNTAFAVYRYKINRLEIKKLHEVLKKYYQEKRQFDPHFDLETDSLLYCSEIVYKAMVETTGNNNYLPTTKAGAFEFVAIDDLYLKKGIKMICKIIYRQ